MQEEKSRMDLWKLYDKNNKPLGKIVPRGTPLKPGEYYHVGCVIIINQEGKILITRRSQEKINYPLFLECTCGTLNPEEDPLEGSLREVHEETGLPAKKEDLEFLGILRQEDKFSYIYLAQIDAKTEDLRLQKEEVAQGGFFSKEEFFSYLENGDYAPPMEERLRWAYPYYKDLLR